MKQISDECARIHACCFVQKQHTSQQRHWMKQLGKLLYIVERNCKINAAMSKEAAGVHPPTQSSSMHKSLAEDANQTDQLFSSAGPSHTPPSAQQASDQRSAASAVHAGSRGPLLKGSRQSASRGFPPPYPSRYSPHGSRVAPNGGQKQPIQKGANALQRVSRLVHHCCGCLILLLSQYLVRRPARFAVVVTSAAC